ncbi:GNAT family N-acetyltransferase [Arthrobacter sp. UYCo732]|uniref:GNAT family N-acetyltransferase n=1 Tax=Arthrobacter sp. UYCo732 TaxID=3156336 RepID=UPI00339B9D86
MSESTNVLVRPAVEIAPFQDGQHLHGAVEALLKLRRAEGLYPPQRDVEATPTAFTGWLLSEDALGRWVAIVDGQVAGHISITAPHPYLTEALAGMGQVSPAPHGICEVSKFFVDPTVQGKGTGAQLFEAAFRFARREGMQPALAVVSTSLAARRFYDRHGMIETGSFQGIHGENFVFVDGVSDPSWGLEPAVGVLTA